MIDKTAIEAIERLALAAARQRGGSFQGNFETPHLVLQNDQRVESLEKLLDQPLFHRATFTTDSFKSFADYVSLEAKDEDSCIYINKTEMRATCVFNQGSGTSPQWETHKAKLFARLTADYKVLRSCAYPPVSFTQREFADFLEDNAHTITFPDNLTLADARHRIMRLDIQATAKAGFSEGDLNRERTAMESVEISSGDTSPPTRFTFTCVPYVELPKREFECRIIYKTSDESRREGPAISYQIIALEQHEEDIAEQFAERLNSAQLVENIYLGTYEGQ